ncbi:AAA family ATPase [Streptomyces sp. NBC_00536]|uniref:AAA family ATPase n=1 Tax=Streptomyces sp. NBC_00536 TaxID=2975769 RepID=UPI002E80D02A|nr:AAA family ATPase [Streptomyces sp. NBC_00536]WUC79019.1 AAA family ATPase [Streptomyces sp. NBC_00536]
MARLLGRYDHEINFPSEDDFIILHGPNGVGKTMLLELIRATGSPLRVGRIATLPFDSVTFTYSDGCVLEVIKNDPATPALFEPEPEDQSINIRFRLQTPERNTWVEWSAGLAGGIEREARQLSRYLPVERLGPDLWHDHSADESISWFEVLDRYGDLLPQSVSLRKKSMPTELAEFVDQLNIHLIETQRLLTFEPRRPARTPRESLGKSDKVTDFSNDLRRRLAEALAENSRTSQELDRTYPSRLIQANTELPPEDEIRSRYREQNDLRRRLADVSLLDEKAGSILLPKTLADWEKKVLWLYLEDSEKKLSTFKELLDRLSLLLEIINARFLSKNLKIDRNKGIQVVTDDGRELDPSRLSSGEQHELVLLYDLLFSAPAGGLVLIDEPEISLHVTWQQRFLEDIQRIAEVVGFRFIVATHSPQIVGNWIGRAVALTPEREG